MPEKKSPEGRVVRTIRGDQLAEVLNDPDKPWWWHMPQDVLMGYLLRKRTIEIDTCKRWVMEPFRFEAEITEAMEYARATE